MMAPQRKPWLEHPDDIDDLIAFGPFGVSANDGSSIPGLHASVVAALPGTFGQWEGSGLPYMYTDSKGYVTTGTGNLIDPIGAALALPWKHADGSPASQAEISDAWNTVKKAWPSTQSTASQKLTSIRLDSDGLKQLMLKTIAANHSYFVTKYPDYVNWPADAQMAIHSIAWAWGPGFSRVWGGNGSLFDSAVATRDFVKAASIMRQASAHEESINPGIVPRDQGNEQMFQNAAAVLSHKAPVDQFHYPAAFTVSKSKGHPFIGGGLGGLVGFFLGGPVGMALGVAAGAGLSYLKAPSIKLPHLGSTAAVAAGTPLDPKAAQSKLNALGFGPLVVDGALGPKSKAAIIAFQKSKGLSQSGTIDAPTRKALGV